MDRLASSEVAILIDKLVQDETRKRQYYRPIYSIHKWWARRPGALFRAIILLAVYPELKDTLLSELSDGTLNTNSPYFASYNLKDIVILDPFMGGGTTLVEANRLGAKVIGSDINPVAYWTVKETLKPLDLKKLNNYFQQLDHTVGRAIRELYQTTCLYCDADHGESMYTFWVRGVKCPACGEEIPLFKRTLLNEGEKRTKRISPDNPATVFCPKCLNLNQWDGQGEVVCMRCKHIFDPRQGTYDKGKFNCPHCQYTSALIPTLKAGQVMTERVVGIEYWCPEHSKRFYKSPDEYDLARLEQISQHVKAEWDNLHIPRVDIPLGTSTQRWRAHGYTQYHQVFNHRQLWAFHLLLSALSEIPEVEYRDAFLTIFSNILEYNNMMTPYNYPHRKLHHLFTYHAMPLTTTPVENAVWGVGKAGAGTFINGYHRYRKAKLYAQKPYDKFRDTKGKIHTHVATDERIAANYVNTYTDLCSTSKGALLFAQDSANLAQIPTASVDFVISDPPYYDNIHYSELSNFFYVWLRLLTENSAFQLSHVPTEGEAIVSPGQDKGEADYKSLLTAVFTEACRVLKNEGRFIFTFHHTNPRAWWTILAAIGDSGFQIIDTFPIRSEYQVNPHVRDKQALDTDIIFVCAKSPASISIPPVLDIDNPIRRYLQKLGAMLIKASEQWGTHPLLVDEWVERMEHLWNNHTDFGADVSYPLPVATQPRLLEKK